MSTAQVYTIDDEGWLHPASRYASPNFDSRPNHTDISLLVIHNISLPPGQFGGGHVHDFFLNRLDVATDPYFEQIQQMKVSAHFLIERTGTVNQFVSCLDRAWHAGQSSFEGRARCNDFSIGIELEGTDDLPYEDAQYRSLQAVYLALAHHFPCINIDRTVGHEHIAPGRKTDPGPAFDWSRFKQGLVDASGCGTL